jgi:hypothetical protein
VAKRNCVQLSGEDGNAFAILGRTARVLRQAGHDKDELDRYYAEHHDHLLHTTVH